MSFCPSCIREICGEPVPVVLDGIVYAFCRACALEHPRPGRYSFDDSSKVRDSVRSGRSRRSELGGGKARQ